MIDAYRNVLLEPVPTANAVPEVYTGVTMTAGGSFGSAGGFGDRPLNASTMRRHIRLTASRKERTASTVER